MKQKDNIEKILIEIQYSNTSNTNKMIKNTIGDDEKSRREFETYLDVWEKSADVKDFEEVDAESDWSKVRSRMKVYKTRERLPLRSFVLRIAALLIMAVGLTYFFTQVLKFASEGNSKVKDKIAVTQNNNGQLNLEDGTQIALNGSSIIQIDKDFGTKNRDVYLQGEAYFDVARNEDLPFRVFTSNSVVKVLGTSFCVKEGPDEVVVGVVRGKVALYESEDTANRVDLLANNTGYYTISDHKVNSEQTLDLNSIAWHTHRFVFNKTPLNEAGQVVADYYNMELMNPDGIQSFEGVTSSGMPVEPLDSVLKNINDAMKDTRIAKSGNFLIIRKL